MKDMEMNIRQTQNNQCCLNHWKVINQNLSDNICQDKRHNYFKNPASIKVLELERIGSICSNGRKSIIACLKCIRDYYNVSPSIYERETDACDGCGKEIPLEALTYFGENKEMAFCEKCMN